MQVKFRYGTKEQLKKLQDENEMTKLMAVQEDVKMLPFGEIWAEYLKVCNAPNGMEAYEEIVKYEQEVLLKR